jgi:hypothetical protein
VPFLRGGLVFIAQMLGAMAAAGVVKGLFPGPLAVTTSLSGGTSKAQGLFIEMVRNRAPDAVVQQTNKFAVLDCSTRFHDNNVGGTDDQPCSRTRLTEWPRPRSTKEHF